MPSSVGATVAPSGGPRTWIGGSPGAAWAAAGNEQGEEEREERQTAHGAHRIPSARPGHAGSRRGPGGAGDQAGAGGWIVLRPASFAL